MSKKKKMIIVTGVSVAIFLSDRDRKHCQISRIDT